MVTIGCLAIGILIGYDAGSSEASALRGEIATLKDQVTALEGQLEALRNLPGPPQAGNTTILGVYFSPRGGAKTQVVSWIDRANRTLHVLIYSFTDDDIGAAVVRAYQRGVEVRIVFEKNQVSKYSEYWRLRSAGVQVRNDTNPGLMHDKVAVIDGSVILTGSFNWSEAAEQENDENLMVIMSATWARSYDEAFQRVWSESQ